MEKRRRHIVFKSPPLPKKFGSERYYKGEYEFWTHADKLNRDENLVLPQEKALDITKQGAKTSPPPNMTKSSTNPPPPKVQKSNYLRAFGGIFLLTMGAGVFALPKAMEPLNSPLWGITSILVTGLIVLFSYYSILRSSPDNMFNRKDFEPRDDIFVEIVNKRFDSVKIFNKRFDGVESVNKRFDGCCSVFKYFFAFFRWILRWIYAIAYIDIVKTYLDLWTQWDLKTKPIFQSDIHNPILWLIGIVGIVGILTVVTLMFNERETKEKAKEKAKGKAEENDEENDEEKNEEKNEENDEEKNEEKNEENVQPQGTFKYLSNGFKCVKSLLLTVAGITITIAVLGIIYMFAKGINLSTFWSDLLDTSQNEDMSGYDRFRICVGSVVPVLCINFLNHLDGISKLYKYIFINKRKLIFTIKDKTEDPTIQGRYNFFPYFDGCCYKAFEKSRMFAMAVSQVFFTLLYILVPVLALLSSGGSVEGNILTSLTSSNDVAVIFLQACSGFGVLIPLCFLDVPMIVQPVRDLLLNFLGFIQSVCKHGCNFKDDDHFKPKNMLLSCGLDVVLTLVTLLICFNMAVFTPLSFDIYMRLAGSLCASLIILVFPAMIHLAALKSDIPAVKAINRYNTNNNLGMQSGGAKNTTYNCGCCKFTDTDCFKFEEAYCCRFCRFWANRFLCRRLWFTSTFYYFYKCLEYLSLCDRIAGFLSIVSIVVGLLIFLFGIVWNIEQLKEVS
jgi:hypothetical protein